jgi:hypothetical protein
MTIDINDAAKIIMTGESEALVALKDALDTCDAALDAIEATLPDALTLDARRIISETRGSMSYRRLSELPALIARYIPADPASFPEITPPA